MTRSGGGICRVRFDERNARLGGDGSSSAEVVSSTADESVIGARGLVLLLYAENASEVT